MSYPEWRQEQKKTSGGATGALDPDSRKANEHAKRYYESIRKRKGDAKTVSINTGLSEAEIESVRQYLFIKKHDLGRGKFERFDPDYRISESWRRLVEGKNIQPHDLTMLHHKIEEQRLRAQGKSQSEAHK